MKSSAPRNSSKSQKKLSAGFSKFEFVDSETNQPTVELFVPSKLAEELELQRQEDSLRAREEQRRKEAERRAVLEAEYEAEQKLRRERQLQEKQRQVQQDEPTPTPVPGVDFDPLKQHLVIQPAEVDRLIQRIQGLTDRQERERLQKVVDHIKKVGLLRDIGSPGARNEVDAALNRLAQAQPHFAEVVEFVRGRYLLAAGTRQPVRIPPILLYGEPGVGKTHFAHSLAESLGTIVFRQTMDSAQTNSTLTGSDKHWGNTQPGLLFELLCQGRYANPIIVLDEVDKARTGNSYDPLGPLHTILEPSTAPHVRDASLDLAMDTSLVTWIMTANNHFKVPTSIRSRARVFHIKLPMGEQAIALASNVVESVLKKLLPDAPAPERRLAVALAHLSAREIYQATEDAVANALKAGRKQITERDLPTWAVFEEDVSTLRFIH